MQTIAGILTFISKKYILDFYSNFFFHHFSVLGVVEFFFITFISQYLSLYVSYLYKIHIYTILNIYERERERFYYAIYFIL